VVCKEHGNEKQVSRKSENMGISETVAGTDESHVSFPSKRTVLTDGGAMVKAFADTNRAKRAAAEKRFMVVLV